MAIAEPVAQILRPARDESSRTCPATGLRVYAGAQTLTLANAVAAVLALALGGLFGGLIGLSRSPALELLGPSTYYASLTAHGVAALVLWPVFFEVAAMVFTSTILLNARVYSMALGWASFGLMVGGALITFVTIMSGSATVMFTAYPPLVATPWFYVGYLLFAVGATLAVVNFVMSIVQARADGIVKGSLPVITYGVACAGILALLSILSGLVAFIPALFYSLGWIEGIDPIVYRGWFWGLGHTLQYVNVVAMVVAWYGIIALAFGAGPVNQKFTRVAFILYLLIALPVLGHHFLVDPSLGTGVKFVGGSLMGFLLGIPSLMHGLAILGGVEYKLRAEGATGLFGWLKRVDWSSYGPAALTGSLLIFAIGGWSGTVETTLPLNLVNHNTMGVPAHLHSTVVGGMTVAFMGFAYYLVPLLTRRRLWGGKLATVQAYGYSAGLLLLIIAQTWAGILGVPRRTQSSSYGSDLPSGWDASMNLNGIGAALAGAFGALFIVIMVLTLLVGKKTDVPGELVPAGAK
jgi:cytochrome c oxidase subunit 1